MIGRGELIVDNFAGGGGASTGILWALGRGPDVAINHDPEAMAMHAANHPATRHLCQSVWKADPRGQRKPLTKTAQIRMCGNSVCPQVAAAVVAANAGSESLAAAAE